MPSLRNDQTSRYTRTSEFDQISKNWANQMESQMGAEEVIYDRGKYDVLSGETEGFKSMISVDVEREKDYESISELTSSTAQKSDCTTRIYACATMWHETQDEMMEVLKSILRMDEDQCARRVAQKYLRVVDPDYYEFETHIFFDDAFESSDVNDWSQVNGFVKQLVSTLDDAASQLHETHVRIRPPFKYPTPYGGRLVWTLPGKTQMIAHLKDKSKIRHRKRWSQVMYMYYLLGHRLMELPISVERKETMAENTYLLTLDGDIEFQPQAVKLLVDLMKANRNLGAACGRVHPIGSGPMVWYQIFEYAIGHWLHKASEDIIGCVLCSPGCFSLIRGKSLMDDGVMRKYTRKSNEARHFVQYDQGEDRWLSTLLLQKGYRVKYSAASDAYTHCPEGFNEFYNQRRRWVPSTMANIIDLLVNYKATVKINDNISLPYIFYQFMMMGVTLLGPGTIFIMMVGSFEVAFKLNSWTCFFSNFIPIVLFMLVCFTCKANIQLYLARILSTAYALVMLAVVVGAGLNMCEDGVSSPSAVFLMASAGSLLLIACLHPQEFWCIVPGTISFLSIPSMYLLLILYSIININVVSWGTREVQAKKTKKLKEQEESKENKQRRNKEGSSEFSIAGLFRPKPEKQQLVTPLEGFEKRLYGVERTDPHEHPQIKKTLSNKGYLSTDMSKEDIGKIKCDDEINPFWIEDLKKGPVAYLSANEVAFWRDLIDKYLFPIDDDTNERTRIAKDLIKLRNFSVIAILTINGVFVIILYLLQWNKDGLHLIWKWPLGVKTIKTYNEVTKEEHVYEKCMQLEPVGLLFASSFVFIMTIQFTAMLFHRIATISHIWSSTELNWCCAKRVEESSQDLDKQAVDIVRHLQKLKGINEDSGQGGRRTNHDLEKQKQKARNIGTLEVAFRKRFLQMTMEDAEDSDQVLGRKLKIKREVREALEVRRRWLEAEMKKAQIQKHISQRNNSNTEGSPILNLLKDQISLV